ncbi:hypothetical protein Sango_0605100 [Sesamum angolense]|uniref:RNA-binding protein n=1 Tax=Sesamum angolense TaxID=2727404 RepID=A0AAE1X6C8_9LAMI|nr:hypothetical protein Sango_0605100 [Sesamum angolense]
MATAFPLPVTAAQVGTYFVGQYYQMLQNQPNFVHQFYSDASTMLRIDGNTRETATAMLLAKGQSAVPAQSSSNKPATSEWQHVPEPPSQPSVESPNPIERSGVDTLEEASFMEDEVEVKSVYVRNVPTTMAASEIAEEFKKFGTLKPDAVAIRTRKDIDVCYAFVEFEDITGVQNAIKASTVQIGTHQLHIEGRRPNRNISTRGGNLVEPEDLPLKKITVNNSIDQYPEYEERHDLAQLLLINLGLYFNRSTVDLFWAGARGSRGRVSYQTEGRGRFGGRGFGRGSHQDAIDRDNNRSRGNGFYRHAPRQERAYPTNQQGLRNGHNSSD